MAHTTNVGREQVPADVREEMCVILMHLCRSSSDFLDQAAVCYERRQLEQGNIMLGLALNSMGNLPRVELPFYH